MSKDYLKKCFLLSSVPSDVRAVLSDRSKIHGETLFVECGDRSEAEKLHKAIASRVKLKPEAFAIHTAVYLWDAKRFTLPLVQPPRSSPILKSRKNKEL